MFNLMMMLLYRILYLPGLLLALPYYALRMWRRGGYRKGFSNRFGLMRKIPQKRNDVKRIWIQAVSVGELLAIRPLLEELRKEPHLEVILTTTTSTGLRLLQEKLAALVIWNGVFPIDFWPCSRTAWNRINPDMVMLMEGELWPEHIHQAWIRKVPVILANARLSDRSFKRHYRLRKLAGSYFCKLTYVFAGSETDRQRLLSLGWIAENKIRMTGNLKLDVKIPQNISSEERAATLAEFGMPEDTLLLMGSSTWPGEESALIDTFKTLATSYGQLRLIIVPRHAERKAELEPILDACKVNFHFRSNSRQAPDDTRIYVADTTGELGWLTNFADIVYVGKSLPPNSGGQTPVEAAALAKPIVFGPEMSNFRDICLSLISSGAASVVNSPQALTNTIGELLQSREQREQMGKAARGVIQDSKGATQRLVQEIRDLLSL